MGKERFVGEGDKEYREEGETHDPGVKRPFGVVDGTRRDGDDVFRLVGDVDNGRFKGDEEKGLGDVTVGEKPMGDGIVNPLV